MDCLALDLRRGVQLNGSANCYTVDADGQGLKITVPDLYRFAANDPQHLFPIIVAPTYDPTTQTAYYNGSATTVPAGGPYPAKIVAYRFNAVDGSITRSDPWAPLLVKGPGGQPTATPMVVATNMESFPQLTPDPGDISGNTVHYGVSFHSAFRTYAAATSSPTEITLRHVTFIRSKNLAH